MEPKFYL